MGKKPLLFGRFGWSLLAISAALILVTTFFLPNLLDSFQLKMPEKWTPVTRLIVQVTLGSWVAASAMSIVQAVVWLRCKLVLTNLEQYECERDAVTLVRNSTLWMLGIMTALAGYVTIWFSGG